jgi:hypothetical protein
MKKRFRIIQVDSVSGRWYYPQKRTLFGKWVCMYDWVNTIQRWELLEGAIDYLGCNDIYSTNTMTVWEGEE